MNLTDPRHGTYAGASQHYKAHESACGPCETAARRRRKLNKYLAFVGRPATLPGVGVVRRVEALQTLGWSLAEISRRSGVPWKTLLGLYRHPGVYRATFDAIADLYDELAMHAATGPYAVRTRRRAQAHGFHPPEAWQDVDDPDETPTRDHTAVVDEVVVQRLLAGVVVQSSSRPEREEAMRRWLAQGRPEGTLNRMHGWANKRYRPTNLGEIA